MKFASCCFSLVFQTFLLLATKPSHGVASSLIQSCTLDVHGTDDINFGTATDCMKSSAHSTKNTNNNDLNRASKKKKGKKKTNKYRKKTKKKNNPNILYLNDLLERKNDPRYQEAYLQEFMLEECPNGDCHDQDEFVGNDYGDDLDGDIHFFSYNNHEGKDVEDASHFFNNNDNDDDEEEKEEAQERIIVIQNYSGQHVKVHWVPEDDDDTYEDSDLLLATVKIDTSHSIDSFVGHRFRLSQTVMKRSPPKKTTTIIQVQQQSKQQTKEHPDRSSNNEEANACVVTTEEENRVCHMNTLNETERGGTDETKEHGEITAVSLERFMEVNERPVQVVSIYEDLVITFDEEVHAHDMEFLGVDTDVALIDLDTKAEKTTKPASPTPLLPSLSECRQWAENALLENQQNDKIGTKAVPPLYGTQEAETDDPIPSDLAETILQDLWSCILRNVTVQSREIYQKAKSAKRETTVLSNQFERHACRDYYYDEIGHDDDDLGRRHLIPPSEPLYTRTWSHEDDDYVLIDPDTDDTRPSMTPLHYDSSADFNDATVPVQVKPKEVSRNVHVMHEQPSSQIHWIENFISSAECQELAKISKQEGFAPAVTLGQDGELKIDGDRQARQSSVPLEMHFRQDRGKNKIPALYRRMFDYANHNTGFNLSMEGQEELLLIHYTGKGQPKHQEGEIERANDSPDQYKPHCDGNCQGGKHVPGTRVATLVAYCETAERGGATNFKNAGVKLVPKVGDAVFFSYMSSDDKIMDTGYTTHSGCPVLEGNKTIVTQWMRLGVSRDKPWDSWTQVGVQKTGEEPEEV